MSIDASHPSSVKKWSRSLCACTPSAKHLEININYTLRIKVDTKLTLTQAHYIPRSTGVFKWITLTLSCPASFGNFGEKKRPNARGFAWEYPRSCSVYGPIRSVKRRGKSSSLHSKKIFLLGVVGFCEWRHKWRTSRPPWPTLPGPGRQPLGGSISLKFLLETRLQSESFDTLDDLLGFWVQNLWCKLVKIFD